MKLMILSFFKKIGFIVKLNNAKNNEELLIHYLIREKNVSKIIDIGANKGQFAESIFKRNKHLRVVSFEPLPEAYKILAQKVAQNNHWESYNCAIGSDSSESTIYVSENSHSSSLLKINQNHLTAEKSAKVVKEETVSVKLLSDVIKSDVKETLMLKIDTQGFELEVLKGSIDLFSKVELIIVELSFVQLYDQSAKFSTVINFLEEYGFILYQIFPEFTNQTTHQLLQANGVFVKK